MVKNNMYHEIKRMQKAGVSRNRISKEMGIDKKTVRKYWNMEDTEYHNYIDEYRYREKEFEIFKGAIIELYAQNEFNKLPIASVYDFLEERHGLLPANENSLRNYTHYLIETNQLTINNKFRHYTKVPELPYGKQMQLDFGEIANNRGGKYYILGAVLSASRFKFAAIQEKPFTAKDLIGYLLDCFDYIGGIPVELVIDQDSIMVVSENAGDILYTKDFNGFIEEMKMKMYVCRKADPESKGKIENLIKFIKNSFFSVRKFENLKECRESLLKWLERRANGKISQATMKIPLIEIEEERKSLKPLRNSIYRKEITSARELRTVNEKCRIMVDSSHYDLPDKYRNKEVEIYKTSDKLFVFDHFTGLAITEYPLSFIPGQIVTDRSIVRNKGLKLAQLKEEVLGYFPLPNWKVFLEANHSRFARYVRDQCLEARKHFTGKGIDENILDSAIACCLENQTLSMSNLNDSYQYFHREGKEKSTLSQVLLEKIQNNEIKVIGNIEVSKPDLNIYKSLIQPSRGSL